MIPNLFFRRGSFSCNTSAKFEQNLQIIFAFFFGSKEATPLSFNDILDCLSHLEGIPRDFKARQSSLGLFLFSANFFSK